MKQQLEKYENEGLEVVAYISKHRTVIIIFVACAAVMAAVLQTQSYLNPARNEAKYTEVKTSITAKKIDEAKLEKLEQTQTDKNETVDSNFVEDRVNPFTE